MKTISKKTSILLMTLLIVVSLSAQAPFGVPPEGTQQPTPLMVRHLQTITP